jgi:hypothetical protein
MVIDMAMFSEKAIRSETPVEIPWSDWGPKYTWCFPHHPSHRISVFGSKMAYTLPRDCTPEPGQRVEALSSEDHFYVHIWDFNKRLIARSENTHDPNLPEVVIRKPGQLAQSCFDEDLTSNRPYITSVCAEAFSTHQFDRVFLEQDRLTLTRVGVFGYDSSYRNDLTWQNHSRLLASLIFGLFYPYRLRLAWNQKCTKKSCCSTA